MARKKKITTKQIARLTEERVEEIKTTTETVNVQKVINQGKRSEKRQQARQQDEGQEQGKQREDKQDQEQENKDSQKQDEGKEQQEHPEEQQRQPEQTKKPESLADEAVESADEIPKEVAEEGTKAAAEAGVEAAEDAEAVGETAAATGTGTGAGGATGAAGGAAVGGTAGAAGGAAVGGTAGATTGGATGAGGALVVGQAGPQIFLPEEVITVPAAGAVGAATGGTAGAAGGAATGGTAGAAAGGATAGEATAARKAGEKGVKKGGRTAAKIAKKAKEWVAKKAEKKAKEELDKAKKEGKKSFIVFTVVAAALSGLISFLAILWIIASILIAFQNMSLLQKVDLAKDLLVTLAKSGGKAVWNATTKATDRAATAMEKAADKVCDKIEGYWHNATNGMREAVGLGQQDAPATIANKDDVEGVKDTIRQAALVKTKARLGKLFDQLDTNGSALFDNKGNSEQAVKLTIKNLRLTKLIRTELDKLGEFEKKNDFITHLETIEQLNNGTLDGMAVITYSSNREPMLQIGQDEIQNLFNDQISESTLTLLTKLGDKQSEKIDLPIYQLSPNKIGNILAMKPDQQAKEIARVLAIDNEYGQIKFSNLSEGRNIYGQPGQQIETTSIGKYPITSSLGTIWQPLNIRYQAQYRPSEMLKYQTPTNPQDLAFDLINKSYQGLFLINPRIKTIDQAVIQTGVNRVGQEIGVNREYLTQSTLEPQSIGLAMIDDSLRLAPGTSQEIVNSQETYEIVIGKTYLANSLGIPAQSLSGNTRDERLSNIAVAFLKEQFGLVNTKWQGSFANQDLGQAIIEQAYGSNNQELIETLISDNQNQAKRKLGLTSLGNFDQLPFKVGSNFKSRLFAIQSQTSLSQNLGLYDQAIAGLENNSQQTKVKIGINVLANHLGINNAKTITADQIPNAISEKQLPLEIKTEAIQAILSTGTNQSYFSELGQGIYSRINGDKVNSYLKTSITNTEQAQALIQDKNKLAELAKTSGENSLKDIFASKGPVLNGYLAGNKDWQDVEAGKWIFPSYHIGSAVFDTRTGLPENSWQTILTGVDTSAQSLSQVGLALAMKDLGINQSMLLQKKYQTSTNLELSIGQMLVESQGLTKDSFQGSINKVAESNDWPRLAAMLNITAGQMKNLKENKSANKETRNKLNSFDQSLRLANNSSYKLFTNKLSVDQYARQVGQSAIQSSPYQILGNSNDKQDFLMRLVEIIIQNKFDWPINQLPKQLNEPWASYQLAQTNGLPQVQSIIGYDLNNFNQLINTFVQSRVQNQIESLGGNVSLGFVINPQSNQLNSLFSSINSLNHESTQAFNQLYQKWQNNQINQDQLFEELKQDKFDLTDEQIADIFQAYQWESFNNQKPTVNFWIYLAYKLGIGQEIDEEVGIPYFAEELVVGLTTNMSDAYNLSHASWSVDPSALVDHHSHNLLNWTINSEVMPSKFNLFNQSDVDQIQNCTPNTEARNSNWDQIKLDLY